MRAKRRGESWAAGCKPSDLRDELGAWSKVCDQKPRDDGSRHPEIDSPIGYPPDFGLGHSNRRSDPSPTAGAPALHPDKPDKKNEADNQAQLHFSSHSNRIG